MTRRMSVLAIGGAMLVGCVSSGNPPTAGSTPASSTPTDRSASADSSTETAPTVDETTTTQVAETVDVSKTIARPSEGDLVATLLPAVDDPSPLNGTAVPQRPNARCALGEGQEALGRYEILGCEFDDDSTADAYMKQWADAIADPHPTWHGGTMTTTSIDAPPNWVGRSIDGEIFANDEVRPRTRVDLVQQRGRRVYVVTVTDQIDEHKLAVLRAKMVADAQQEQLDTLEIDEHTGPGEVEADPDYVSVRGATPTWQELYDVAPHLTGHPGAGGDLGTTFHVETYSRTLAAADVSDGRRLRVSVEREDDAGGAANSVLYDVAGSCLRRATAVDGVATGVRCSTDSGVLLAAHHGPFSLTIEVPEGVDVDPVQRLFVDWNRRFVTLPLPVDEPSPTYGLPPRTDTALPTDPFPIDGYDGSYDRIYVSDDQASATYQRRGTAAESENDYYHLSVKPGDQEFREECCRGDLVDLSGEPTSDGWAVATWQHEYRTGDEYKTYEVVMMRSLPSGDRLEVEGEPVTLAADAEGPDAPFPIDGPLLTSTWEWFLDYSLDDYPPPSEPVVEVRRIASAVATAGSFNRSIRSIFPFSGNVAPDSPPGTTAEWRVIQPTSNGGTDPEAVRRVIAFDDATTAERFVSVAAEGLAMSPIGGVPEVEGGFNAGAGLIVMRRGKWVVVDSSPGRTDWSSTLMANGTSIGDGAFYFAQQFANSGLV